jgi:predicted  nucleic acid-binding Zn-ribbon protein
MRRQIPILIGAILVCTLQIPTRANGALSNRFEHLAKAGNIVLKAVGTWNKKLDDLTDQLARTQLRGRLDKLYTEMTRLLERKQDLLESVKQSRGTARIQDDLRKLRESVKEIRASLDAISSELNVQLQGTSFETEIRDDLNDRIAALYAAGSAPDSKVQEELVRAIQSFKKAKAAVAECILKLQMPIDAASRAKHG